MTKNINPTTMEVVRYGMLQTAEEMTLKLMHASNDMVIYVSRDFSCGVFTAKGEMIAQSLGLPHFLANLGKSVTSTAEDIGGFDKFSEGDVYLTNDPYRVVLHLPDVDVLMPVFFKDQLVAFAASRAHWIDIGASQPGTNNATEIFQEGVIYRSLRVYDNYEPIPDILRLLRENSRAPDVIESNLRAQVAASIAGRDRIIATIEKYGVDSFLSAFDGILKHGEEIAHRRIGTFPDGEYAAEGYIDNDAQDLNVPLKICVKVRVDGNQMSVDLEGSQPKVLGCMNSGREQTITACRMGFAALMPVGFPINEGVFKALNVIIPSGSIFDGQKPSATSLGYQAGDIAKDLMQVALAPVIPEVVCAANYGNAANLLLTGIGKDGSFGLLVDVNAGGAGAKPFEDGENAMIFGNLANIPVEVKEKTFPGIIERYRLRQNSEGPGKYRGGFGLELDMRFTGVQGWITTWIARYQVPTFGILGGGVPPLNKAVLNPGTPDEKDISRVAGEPLKEGDLIQLVTSGGGGYGNPFERAPKRVKADVLDELITLGRAKAEYGVVFEKSGYNIDEANTKVLRKSLK